MATLRYKTSPALSQDLLFGLKPEILVPLLTRMNWRKAALVNLVEGQRIYTFIQRLKLRPENGGAYVYKLNAHDLDTRDHYGPWGVDFKALKEALDAANLGEPINPNQIERRYAEISLVAVTRFRKPEVKP